MQAPEAKRYLELWGALPTELLVRVLSRLPPDDAVAASLVSRHWRAAALDTVRSHYYLVSALIADLALSAGILTTCLLYNTLLAHVRAYSCIFALLVGSRSCFESHTVLL